MSAPQSVQKKVFKSNQLAGQGSTQHPKFNAWFFRSKCFVNPSPMIFRGILLPKPHLRYRTRCETAAVQKNLSFKHEFLQNLLLEYI